MSIANIRTGVYSNVDQDSEYRRILSTDAVVARAVGWHIQTSAQGIALISALLIVALVALLVAGLFQRQASTLQMLQNQAERTQAKWLLRGTIDWARLILQAQRTGVDHLGQVWSVALAETTVSTNNGTRTATISGRIEDAQARFNLKNLAENGKEDEANILILEQLLQNLNLDKEIAKLLTTTILQTQPSSTSQSIDAQIGFRGAADLANIPGIKPEALTTLLPYITYLPEKSDINANTASAEVLAAAISGLSLSEAKAVVSKRSSITNFKDLADVANNLPVKNPPLTLKGISVNSNWFLANGQVAMGNAHQRLEVLIQRANNTANTLWEREAN